MQNSIEAPEAIVSRNFPRISSMSTINVEYLVVGGDGLIGSHLVTKLRKIGARVVKTTRRKVKDDINSIRLNLSSSALDLSSWTYTTKEGGSIFMCRNYKYDFL